MSATPEGQPCHAQRHYGPSNRGEQEIGEQAVDQDEQEQLTGQTRSARHDEIDEVED
jgi:hypothetical protein